jgi:hypothetical protein
MKADGTAQSPSTRPVVEIVTFYGERYVLYIMAVAVTLVFGLAMAVWRNNRNTRNEDLKRYRGTQRR